jgi:hypothetical protein
MPAQKYKRKHTKKFSKLYFVHGNKIAMLFTHQFVCKSVEMMLGRREYVIRVPGVW